MAYQQTVRKGHLGKTGMFWLSMMDHARYLTWFKAFLINIDLSHPGALGYIKLGAIAVARSLIPGALSAVDKTMEETFMKFAKTSGGLLGRFNMFGAYQKWCRTTSARAQLYELTLEMCGMIDDPDCPKAGKHREVEPSQIKKSEEAVQRIQRSRLIVLRAEAAGRAAKEQFIHDRFVSKKKDFFERLKKLKLKTMDHCSKKLFVYQEQSNLAFQLLVKSQMLDMPINLDELMRYPPLALFLMHLASPDGYFAKTNKATILHYLLQDRNEELLDQMIGKHHFVFSTDCYQPDSIKAQERLRSGFTEKYIIDGPHTRKPIDFKAFLGNELNKKQLCDLLLKVQASEIHALRSNQEETDSRIILYLHQAVKWGYKSSIVRDP
ncbi:hypothetical protein SKAU_G00244840 [Synaphobranchus kaupii]|uniref:Uncharacterized protein n=1 Tax=Synaphobranchus kaupii TaxID=118154 RepID=A0A9Q1IP94_SYNKA|nr:hypothetical protein SKAU_G00244840 [Synaphobranchus kaupii]